MAATTKIDWADSSWNPITGCRHACPYCYARSMAKRFGNHITDGTGQTIHDLHVPFLTEKSNYSKPSPYPFDFEPTFHRYRLGIPAKWTKPRNIFVCSMADLFGDWVPDQWIIDVLNACRKAPQHRYLFLTKNPARYDDLEDKGIITPQDQNFWLGSTVTVETRDKMHWNRNLHTFQSCEPILAPWPLAGKPNQDKAMLPEWVIFGAETGNRKGKVIPPKEWIDNAVQMCRNMGAAVFMKESLRHIMGLDFVQEFPWG